MSTRELAAFGMLPTEIAVARSYGTLQALRQGWHCEFVLPDVFRTAWRFGGPLACISALSMHEGRARGCADADIPFDEPLHVAVPRNSVGSPPAELLAERWGIPVSHRPVLHWGTADALSGDRRAVSAETARQQALRCRARDETQSGREAARGSQTREG